MGIHHQSFEGVSIHQRSELLRVSTTANINMIVDHDRAWAGKSEWSIRAWSREFVRQEFGVKVLEIDYDVNLFGCNVGGRGSQILAFWAYETSLTSLVVPKLVVNPKYRRMGIASAVIQHLLYSPKSQEGQEKQLAMGGGMSAVGKSKFKTVCLMVPFFDTILGPLAQSLGFSRHQVTPDVLPVMGQKIVNAAGHQCQYLGQTLGVPDYDVLANRMINQLGFGTKQI